MTCKFIEMLDAKQAEGKLVCVGLDSDFDELPNCVIDDDDDLDATIRFNRGIVEATGDLICCDKPNSAFYEEDPARWQAGLEGTFCLIRETCPGLPIVLDAKRGDIGKTNKAYAKGLLGRLNADAITIHPYLGEEANVPFLKWSDKGIIVLCKTSNPGSGEFQDKPVYVSYEELAELTDSQPLPKGFEDQWTAHIVSYDKKPGYLIPFYQYVALRVSRKWNKHGNCLLVVGATYPEQLKFVRQIVGDDMYILLPGIGKQGGDLEASLRNGLNSRGTGLIVNSSSGIIFASKGEDYAEAARRETLKLHEQITAIRAAMRQEKKP
ncbi:MAG: orotidine-5'-phosphate decarboxylase [Patescibacteria group bacterium]|nr:orotidine-5'-phosphate decarboxylase [Patescibacteria group bacterium]